MNCPFLSRLIDLSPGDEFYFTSMSATMHAYFHPLALTSYLDELFKVKEIWRLERITFCLVSDSGELAYAYQDEFDYHVEVRKVQTLDV